MIITVESPITKDDLKVVVIKAREFLKATQEEFATLMGVSNFDQSEMEDLTSDETPSIGYIINMAEKMDLSLTLNLQS